MSLRTRFLLYLLTVHVAFAAVAVVALLRHQVWLLAVELFFAISLGTGWALVRSFFVPLNLIHTGADLLEEQDFTSHFRETGQPEMDELIRIYNRMVDRLREERLRLQEQHFLLDRIFAVSPSGLLTLDLDGRIDTLNPTAARLLGVRSPESALGSPPGALDSPLAREMAAVPVDGSRVAPLQGRRRVRIAHAKFFDRGFGRSFFLLEELTEELRASERSAYRKLIRMMSHEINNSVGSVGSLLESCRTYAVQLNPEDRTDFEKALSVARSRLENLNAFMRGFAEVVRLPSPEPRPCDLPELVRDTLTLLGPDLARRRIRAECDIAGAPAPVPLDKNQMEQVLGNVLRNGMEAIEADGTISVALGRIDGRWRLSVRDSGPGVPPEAAASLFAPFFSTKKNGRGLGLTLVQEILAAHRFDFGLENHPEGGAEFWIRF